MAFTLAHPAAVIPLRKVRFMALLPLIIGSMTPDLIGFLPYAAERRLPHSHSPIGMVLIDLPTGYLLLFALLLFRNLLVRPLWEPHRTLVTECLNDFYTRPQRWRVALPSLLAGSLTHIVWDRFTHHTGWTYRNLPLLYQPLFPDTTHQLPLFHVLQYVTSVVGLAFLGWCYWQTLRRATPLHAASTAHHQVRLLAVLAIAALLLGMARLWSGTLAYDSIYVQLSLVLKTAIISFSLLYFLYGLILWKTAHRSS